MIDTDLFVIQPQFIAQDGGAPNLGGGGGGATQQPGGTTSNGGGAGGGGGLFDPTLMLLLFLVIVIMLIFSSSSQRKERKKKEALINALRKHDEVQTIGGIIGSVVDIRGDRVVLKVDESSNTRMTFSKASIQQVLRSRSQSSKESKEDGDENTPD